MKLFIRVVLFIVAINFCSLHAFAIQVDTRTTVTLLRPVGYDGGVCDLEVFSKKISDLGLHSVPVVAAYSKHDSAISNPAGNRDALVVAVNQTGIRTDVLRIEGTKVTVTDIEKKLASGLDVRLTEFKKCSDNDPSLQLVELVNLTPNPTSFSVDFNTPLQVLRKNDQGVCDVTVNKTLNELIRDYNPGVDLSAVSYSVNIFAGGVTADGKLYSKRIYISFRDKDGFLIARPSISVTVASDLVYTVLDHLSGSRDILRMSGFRECLGTRMDDPIWVLDFKFQ